MTGDIERMIGILVTPYVDDSMLSLDDEEASLQVGSLDPSFRKMEFIEELDHLLTPGEKDALRRLTECYWMDSQQGHPPLVRYAAPRYRDQHLVKGPGAQGFELTLRLPVEGRCITFWRCEWYDRLCPCSAWLDAGKRQDCASGLCRRWAICTPAI